MNQIIYLGITFDWTYPNHREIVTIRPISQTYAQSSQEPDKHSVLLQNKGQEQAQIHYPGYDPNLRRYLLFMKNIIRSVLTSPLNLNGPCPHENHNKPDP